jgi:predicted nucleic acid-binding protein
VKALVLDVSVTLAFVLTDELSVRSDRILDAVDEHAERLLVVPGHFWIEVTNGLLMAERRGRTSRAEMAEALRFVFALSIVTDDETSRRCPSESLSLAREYGLTVYDAAYLELALRHRADLATLDKALAKAAKAAGLHIIE